MSPDTPYDQAADADYTVDDDLSWVLSTRVLLAIAAAATLVVGACCAAVGLILTAPGATWTGAGLVTAAAVVLRVLWVRGRP